MNRVKIGWAAAVASMTVAGMGVLGVWGAEAIWGKEPAKATQEKIWIFSDRRLFHSQDTGKTWVRQRGLPLSVRMGSREEEQEVEELLSAGRASLPGTLAANPWPGNPGALPGKGNAGFPAPAPVSIAAPPADFKPEPTIQQVQRVVAAYSEVGPEKIRRWRGLARWRAFIPSFTIGLDQDRDTNVVSSTAAGTTKFTVGPDRLTRSLDFGFTWDLGDFLWSSDQTAIDVRSRLTTQLRQDLLEEATRLYFERKRLLAEFAAQPSEDAVLLRERQLRVAELTAYLDALTGGWFSRQLDSHSLNG